MRPGLHECRAERGQVRLTTRFWDGIDKPEITPLESLAPAQARAWADRLIDAAAQAETQSLEAAIARRDELRSQWDQIDREIRAIESEIKESGEGKQP